MRKAVETHMNTLIKYTKKCTGHLKITHSVAECCKRSGRVWTGVLKVNGVPVNPPASTTPEPDRLQSLRVTVTTGDYLSTHES